MPGFLLHQGATVQCMHSGQAAPTIVSEYVSVGGMPITLQPNDYTVSGCTLPSVPAPACLIGKWTTAATQVFSKSMPVLLMDSEAICSASGGRLVVIQTQTQVSGK